jgi:phage terminase small subunit
LKLRGTLRGDRRHADEPTPDICIPKKPSFLKGAAAKEWKRIAIELHTQKLLSEMDLAALAGYCHAYGEVIKIDKAIAKQKKDIEHVRKAMLVRLRRDFGVDEDQGQPDAKSVEGFGFGVKPVDDDVVGVKVKEKKKTWEEEIFLLSHSAEYLCTGAKGSLVLNPLIKARAAAWELVLKFGREFGLSPVARTRISTGNADDANPWLAKMKQNAG